MDPERQPVSDDDLRAAYAAKQLLCWCRLVDDTYEWPGHLRKLCATLEAVERGEVRRLIVSMPPRHGKSLTTTKRFPAWFLGRNPDKRCIIAAHTASLAESFSRVARNELAEHGPRVFDVGIAGDSSSVQSWAIDRHRGGLVAAGVGGALTGQGADLLVIDDPVKDYEAAFSETQREAVWEWYRTVARTRVHPGGAIVLVMTRWHQDDLAGRLLAEAAKGAERWEQVVMPMVDDANHILWADRFPRAEVDSIRTTVGSYAWGALYQQRPTSPAGDIVKRDWWKYYSLDPREMAESCDELLQSWDCTFKDTDGSDYVVGQVWGRKGARKYLLDQVRDRMSFTATCAAMRAMTAKWPQATLKLVEDKANGPAVIESLEQEVAGIVAVDPQGGKEARARAVSPQVEAGNVWLPDPKNAPWVQDYVEEWSGFPRGKHDDQVDSTTQALLRLQNGGFASLLEQAMGTL